MIIAALKRNSARRAARRWFIAFVATVAAFSISMLAAPLDAQQQLRVINRTPADSATPGSFISVTFDRPVAGSLDNAVDARTVMRFTPSVAGTVSWRDPVTVRFIPTAPLRPGSSLTVTIDTAVSARCRRSR